MDTAYADIPVYTVAQYGPDWAILSPGGRVLFCDDSWPMVLFMAACVAEYGEHALHERLSGYTVRLIEDGLVFATDATLPPDA